MGDLFFVIRMFLISLVIMLMFQVRIGTLTVEEHSLSWLRESSFAHEIQETGQGAALFIRDIFQKVGHLLQTSFGDSMRSAEQAGARTIKLIPDRASHIANEAKEKLSQKAEE